MRKVEERLLPPEYVPDTLWDDASEVLLLPEALAKVYSEMIDQHGLRDLSTQRNPEDPPLGGLDKAKTDQHFAQAFDGSVARAQLAILDPKQNLSRVSNSLILALSGNHVCLTDAPCGAGAASFAFLTAISELRQAGVLPRIPLNVTLIGAEISEPAREYASSILTKLQPFFESQGIFVQSDFLHWNVLDPLVNTDLIKHVIRSTSPSSKQVLIVANFSGFLEGERRRSDAEAQLEELFRYISGDLAVALWIEPNMNRAVASGGLFSGVMRWVKERWSSFIRINTQGESSEPILTSESRFQSPINPLQTHAVRVAVMRFDLERSP